jgi:glycosyltransferase involved in cell wall biosynthesis
LADLLIFNMPFIALLCGLALLITIINALSMRVIKPKIKNDIQEDVAILLPMRNEERNVVAVLSSALESQGLPHRSIKVLDDNSLDKTASLARSMPAIEVITGKDLPEGWLGKNFACQQLAESTTATYLVFLDADVRLAPTAINSALTKMKELNWDFISPYPRQIAVSFLERLMQPLLQWSWISSIPLRLAEKLPFRSMIIANGQFFIVRRAAYIAAGGHAAIKSKVLDDLELARALHKHNFAGGVAEASAVSECRMYEQDRDLIAGYTKSLWAAFGGLAGSIFVSALLFVTGILPFLFALAGNKWAWGCYLLLTLSRLVSAARTRSTFSSVFLHPLSMFALIALIVKSWQGKLNGSLLWRGRNVLNS